MVPKGNLLKYSKSFYEKLMLYCGHCEVVCAEAYLIERALHAIWTEDFVEKVIMYQLINNFIQSAKEIDDDIFPLWQIRIGKKVNQYITLVLTGMIWRHRNSSIRFSRQGISSAKVNKFEREFSNKFGFGHSVMVNSGSSANLVMIAALKKYFDG